MSWKVNEFAKPALELIDVSKSYGGTVALSPLSLVIEKGETVALVGPSGSGKTTLLNTIATLVKPNAGGQVNLDGDPIQQLKPGVKLARKVGIIRQQFDLVEQLPVIHNVLAGRLGEWGTLRSLFSLIFPQQKELAIEALERVGLKDKAYQRTSRLSGGEQQRVALARLLIQQPQVILADEPVASLDPARAEDLLAQLVGLVESENQTLIASLHSVEFAKKYFKRIIALRKGKIYFNRLACEVSDNDLRGLYELNEAEGKADSLKGDGYVEVVSGNA